MAYRFSKEDIAEIQARLATMAVRDTDLPEVTDLTTNDTVALVQSGTNVRATLYTLRGLIVNGVLDVAIIDDIWYINGKQVVDADGNPIYAKGKQGEKGAGIDKITCNTDNTITITWGTESVTTEPIQGTKGDKGDKGDTGAQGIQGEKGEKGDTGAQGIQGEKGEKGDTGETGTKGDTGATGVGITSIIKLTSVGIIDTYQVELTDGSDYTFTVTNGRDGTGSGDMSKDVYDADSIVANAGGIQQYIDAVAVSDSMLESKVAAKGFTKNAGTITGIQMNGETKGTSGIVNLGSIITEHQSLTSITEKIPTEASATNQLADKAFVNSSITTATAEFKGTYSTLDDLKKQSANESDYGFVVTQDDSGNTVYNRYKFASGSWSFEYALNNSSFTSEQWTAINSGITTTLVSKLNALPSVVSLTQEAYDALTTKDNNTLYLIIG